MFFLVGLIIACFLIVLLLLKKKKEIHDRVLVLWLSSMTLHLTLHYLHYRSLDFEHPWLLGLILPLPLLHGVFLYLYSIALTENRIVKPVELFLHFIPFLILIGLAIPFYGLPSEQKVEVFRNAGKGYEWYSLIQLILILSMGLLYSVATILKVRKHSKRIQNYLSNTDKKKLQWLEYLAIGLGMIWALVLLFDDTIIFSGVTIFILFIGIFGISQIPVFNAELNSIQAQSELIDSFQETEPENKKYAKSGLEEDEISTIMLRLEQFMATEKPFSESELTLNDLAQKLELNPNQLSQVINSKTGKTFYHYVNTFRIKEFLRLISLPENEKFTLIAVAYDCGFNSKTTFNKYFKLHTGKTPSEYLSGKTQ